MRLGFHVRRQPCRLLALPKLFIASFDDLIITAQPGQLGLDLRNAAGHLFPLLDLKLLFFGAALESGNRRFLLYKLNFYLLVNRIGDHVLSPFSGLCFHRAII